MTSYLSSFVPAPPTLRHLSFSKTLPYSPTLVFDVLSDIASYHEFSTLIASSNVTSTDAQHLPKTAKLSVGYPPLGLVEDWLCLVTCNRQAGTVMAKSGPDGTTTCESFMMKWTVTPQPGSQQQALVKLELELKFRSTVVDQVFAQLESGVAWKMMAKYEKRTGDVEERERKKALEEKAREAEAKKKAAAATSATKADRAPPKKLEVRAGVGNAAPAAAAN